MILKEETDKEEPQDQLRWPYFGIHNMGKFLACLLSEQDLRYPEAPAGSSHF